MKIHAINKRMIGRQEKIDLPWLDLFDLEAKVDTGAYTSALHCHHVKGVRIRGELHVRFRVLDPSHPAYDNKLFTMPVYKRKMVRNSFGQSELRYLIQTVLSIFGEEIPVELSLSDRSRMDYPVLLGRKLLRKRFLVDVSKTNLSSKFLASQQANLS